MPAIVCYRHARDFRAVPSRTHMPLSFKSDTLTGLPVPSSAALAALFLAGIGRLFFLMYPDAFDAYPETQNEYNFYKVDLRCKAATPDAQLVVQGTSRLLHLKLRDVPIFTRRWHTRDRMANISQPLNTFWHMNAIQRRNPGILDAAELWVIDLVPAQFYISYGFTEKDTLFLRESTLDEKLRIHYPGRRMRALVDMVVPLWSHHHTIANWCRALRGLNATPQQRLETLLAIDEHALPDIAGERQEVELSPHDVRRMFAAVGYPADAPIAETQQAAFAELMARRPQGVKLLLVHFPLREDFVEAIRTDGDANTKLRMRELIEPYASDDAHLDWFDTPKEMSITDDDLGPDGFHPSLLRMGTIGKYIAHQYRTLVPVEREGEPQ